MFKKCVFMTFIFVKRCFLIKVVCLIEASLKFMEEKATKLIFLIYVVFAVPIINDQWLAFF